jgi:hypothetical protein
MFCDDIIFDTNFIDNACSQNILFQITVHMMSIKRENISLQNYFFYILLTVYLDAILGNDQLDALFLNVFICASTCFEQQVLIIRRAKLY